MFPSPVLPVPDSGFLSLAIQRNREQLKSLKVPIPVAQNTALVSLVTNLQATPRNDEVSRTFCIQALGQTGEPAVLSSLLGPATSRSKEIRKAVAIALANIHHPLSAFLLLPMLTDDSARVRKTAMRALIQVGQPYTADSILAAALSDAMLRHVFQESLQQLDLRTQRVLLDGLEAISTDPEGHFEDCPELRNHLCSERAGRLWETYAVMARSVDLMTATEAAARDSKSVPKEASVDDSRDDHTAQEETPQDISADGAADGRLLCSDWHGDENACVEDYTESPAENLGDDNIWNTFLKNDASSQSADAVDGGSRRGSKLVRGAKTRSVSRRVPTRRQKLPAFIAASEVAGVLCVQDSSSLVSSDGHVSVSVEPVAATAVTQPDDVEQPTYVEWFREKFLRSRGITFFTAFYLHLLLILLFATVYLAVPDSFEAFAFDGALMDEFAADEGVTDFVETELDFADDDVSTSDPVLPDFAVSTQMPMVAEAPTVALPSMFSTTTSAPAVAESKPKAGVRNVALNNAPAGAVSAGSFSVWTIPDNPDPGEPYKIMIQVRLPEGTEKYAVSDLEGVVVGSDGYQKFIPGTVKGFLPVVNGQVQLEVHIVSADENVEDTVFIRSRLLREAQRLRIQF